MADDVALPVVRERFVDLLPDNHKPVLSGDSDRPREADATVAEVRPEVQQANDLAAQDKEKADADALAKAKAGDEHPVKADAEPVKEPKHDETPPWMKARISKEENRRKEAEAQAAQLREQLLQSEAQVKKLAPIVNPTQEEPRQDNYNNPIEFNHAWSEWRANQLYEQRLANDAQKARENEMQSLQRAHMERMKEAEEKYPGISALSQAQVPVAPPINEAVGAFIIKSKNGPDILHWLDEHREDANRLYHTDPLEAIAELGEIRAQLRAPKAAPKPSAAPRPITPVGGSGGVVRNKYDPGITDSEYFALVDQEQSARLAQLRGTVK